MDSPSSDFFLWRLFALEPGQLTPVERTLLRVALFIGLAVIVCTYWDIRTYSGDDLRNRVVGARVMLAGFDPYTFVWQPGMPEEWLDPVYDNVHRLTVSPPTLLLYVPMAALPFQAQRFISFVAEWLALLASLALLARSLSESRHRVIFLLGATLFVMVTDVWRLHVERGQVYVFQLLALSATIAWSRRGSVDSIAAGIALGALGLMRPNLLVIAPAFLILRQWRSTSAMLTTVGVALAVTFLMLPTSSWQSYLATGDHYYRYIQDPSYTTVPRPDHVGLVEGTQFGVALTKVSSSSFAYLWYLADLRFSLPAIDVALTCKIILAALAALLLVLVWLLRGDARSAFALLIVMSLDTEFFLPHRWGYTDVILLPPLALMLPELLQPGRTNRLALGVVLLGLISGPLGQILLGIHAATFLRSWLVMGGLTALALTTLNEPRPSGSGEPRVTAP